MNVIIFAIYFPLLQDTSFRFRGNRHKINCKHMIIIIFYYAISSIIFITHKMA